MYRKRNLISSDFGKVEGMEVELTLGLENQEGSLDLKLKDCGSSVKDISIKLDGDASWLYQGYVNSGTTFMRQKMILWCLTLSFDSYLTGLLILLKRILDRR
jgi:hypothetical protein